MTFTESDPLELKFELTQDIYKRNDCFGKFHGGKISIGVKNDETVVGIPNDFEDMCAIN